MARNEVRDELNLLLWAGVVSALLARVDAGASREVLVAHGHPIEPGDALDLDDVDHRHVIGIRGGVGDAGGRGKQHHGHTYRAEKGSSTASHSLLHSWTPWGLSIRLAYFGTQQRRIAVFRC